MRSLALASTILFACLFAACDQSEDAAEQRDGQYTDEAPMDESPMDESPMDEPPPMDESPMDAPPPMDEPTMDTPPEEPVTPGEEAPPAPL